MAITSLKATLGISRDWNAQQAVTGLKPITQADRVDVSAGFATTVANAAAGGGDFISHQTYVVAGGGSTTVDMTGLTNVLQQTGQALARIKAFVFELLSTAQGGTAASSVSIGNGNHQLDMGADVQTRVLSNGDGTAWWATGAAGRTVDGANKTFVILNNDGAVAAHVRVTLIGGST